MNCRPTRQETGYASGFDHTDDSKEPRNLAALVRVYERRFRPKSRAELATFCKEPNLEAAIRRAGLAQNPCGKRYSHQRRLTRALLRAASNVLARSNIARAADFDSLYALVDEVIGSMKGIGHLMVYDTALRIGAKLGLSPKHVYLHRGTRAGARALGLDWRRPHLEVEEVPEELQRLEPREIEDFLCIFHRELAHASA